MKTLCLIVFAALCLVACQQEPEDSLGAAIKEVQSSFSVKKEESVTTAVLEETKGQVLTVSLVCFRSQGAVIAAMPAFQVLTLKGDKWQKENMDSIDKDPVSKDNPFPQSWKEIVIKTTAFDKLPEETLENLKVGANKECLESISQ